MVYKKGPPFKVRPVGEIKKDIDQAKALYGSTVRTLFFPAGNTIAMPADDLTDICTYARSIFPRLKRITVYGSSRYVYRHGLEDLKRLRKSGLSRIHVGLESGSDKVLNRIKKSTHSEEQIQAGLWVKEADIELSEYVMLGIGGQESTHEHALETARVLNAINPDFVRLRTFLPKTNTLLLHQIKKGRFQILSPHEVLRETRLIIENLSITSSIHSDHYTNYVDVYGRMPADKGKMLKVIDEAIKMDENLFRPIYVGTQ
jgi:radical SAM superfamily enzyme YgiQ (UPF0313 family)